MCSPPSDSTAIRGAALSFLLKHTEEVSRMSRCDALSSADTRRHLNTTYVDFENVRTRRGRLRRVGPICLADALVDTFEGFVDARNVCVG